MLLYDHSDVIRVAILEIEEVLYCRVSCANSRALIMRFFKFLSCFLRLFLLLLRLLGVVRYKVPLVLTWRERNIICLDILRLSCRRSLGTRLWR